MRNFVRDKRGVVTGLVIMISLCIVTAMIWISTMPAVGMVWDVVNPNLPTEARGPMNMLNNVCGWFLVIFVVGALVYGAAWATRRVPLDYPG